MTVLLVGCEYREDAIPSGFEPSLPPPSASAAFEEDPVEPEDGRSSGRVSVCDSFSAENVPGFEVSGREVCRLERSLCSSFSLEAIAKDYEVPPELDAVLQAIRDTYQPPVQEAAYQGCREGLSRNREGGSS